MMLENKMFTQWEERWWYDVCRGNSSRDGLARGPNSHLTWCSCWKETWLYRRF